MHSVKDVEQKAFDGGVSHRGFPGCVDCSCVVRYRSRSSIQKYVEKYAKGYMLDETEFNDLVRSGVLQRDVPNVDVDQFDECPRN